MECVDCPVSVMSLHPCRVKRGETRKRVRLGRRNLRKGTRKEDRLRVEVELLGLVYS